MPGRIIHRMEMCIKEQWCRGGRQIAVAICGASATGKTELACTLATHLRTAGLTAAHVKLDWFLRSRRVRHPLGLSGFEPASYRWVQLERLLKALRTRGRFRMRPFQQEGGRIQSRTQLVDCSAAVVILDGVLAFHYRFRKVSSLRVFIGASPETGRKLRIEADVADRGYTRRAAEARQEGNYESYCRHVLPLQRYAHWQFLCDAQHRYREIGLSDWERIPWLQPPNPRMQPTGRPGSGRRAGGAHQ
jgi:uridine kinase